MKFISGMLTGILISALFFLFYFKRQVKEINTNTAPPIVEASSEDASKIDNGFLAFYDRFHEDSVYQMEHIVFPLEGIPPRPEDGIIPEGFRWQKADWIAHKLFDSMDGSFVQKLTEVGDDLVIDQIKDSSGSYGMQRRFAKMGDEWFLIYYAGMNELAKDE